MYQFLLNYSNLFWDPLFIQTQCIFHRLFVIDKFSLPKDLCTGAAFQCCLVTRQFAGF